MTVGGGIHNGESLIAVMIVTSSRLDRFAAVLADFFSCARVTFPRERGLRYAR